jgi:seryl-tRNA synthetase
MIEVSRLRDEKEALLAAWRKKHFEAEPLVDQALAYDEERRTLQKKLDDLRHELNRLSKAIGEAMRRGQAAEADSLKAQTTTLKTTIQNLEDTLRQTEEKLTEILISLPNPPHISVPEGRSAADNVVISQGKSSPLPKGHRLPHWEIAEKLGIIDFFRGAKVTGSGFPFYVGRGAKLQRALISYFLDQAAQAGYLEMEAPFLVNSATAFGTGQLPDKDAQMYYVPLDELYLIPTAEVPLTNYYREEILQPEQLPIKLCGYSPCFRREAGSYGKDVRGLNRLHQFDKVEIVQIVAPEHSYETLEEMRTYVEKLVDSLELTWRVVLLCGGDMSFASAKTYDVEVWSPAQERWLEVSSISNFETFQSVRMKLRYRQGKSTAYVHTLNGSALALPRIVASLLETHQTEDGRIHIPKVLQPYYGAEWL